jgi:putative toxin-antitoxin system antitoxin component (TIGR02293 family)
MNNRIRKRLVYSMSHARCTARHWMTDEEYLWEWMAPVGREFGSLDVDRLRKIEVLAHGAIIKRCTDTGLFVGHVPHIGGAHAQGKSREEVILNLQAMLGMMSSHCQGRPAHKDSRKKIPNNYRWLFEPIPEDVLARVYELQRAARGASPDVGTDLRYQDVVKIAAEIFGSNQLAAEWLQQPNHVLGGVRPVDLIGTETGIQSVRQVLNAIARGGVA